MKRKPMSGSRAHFLRLENPRLEPKMPASDCLTFLTDQPPPRAPNELRVPVLPVFGPYLNRPTSKKKQVARIAVAAMASPGHKCHSLMA